MTFSDLTIIDLLFSLLGSEESPQATNNKPAKAKNHTDFIKTPFNLKILN